STATELSNRGNPASSVVEKLTNPSLMTLESSYTPRTCTSIGPVGKRRVTVSPTDAPNDVADDCDSAMSSDSTVSDPESIGFEQIAVTCLGSLTVRRILSPAAVAGIHCIWATWATSSSWRVCSATFTENGSNI